jgi:hypothetical protein
VGIDYGNIYYRFRQSSLPEFAASQEAVNVGAFIMLGTLFGLIVVIFSLVIFLDTEARRNPTEDLHK